MQIRLIFPLLLALLIARPSQAETGLEATFWGKAADFAGVPTSVLYGMAFQESGMRWEDGTFRPWPWTLNLNAAAKLPNKKGQLVFAKAGQRRYRTQEEAEAALTALVGQGFFNVDVGLMQVNLRWHRQRVSNPLQLLDPKQNLVVAAVILRENGGQAESFLAAVGKYHSPMQPGRGRDYSARVLAYAEAIDHAK